jgi:hypothetical protein
MRRKQHVARAIAPVGFVFFHSKLRPDPLPRRIAATAIALALAAMASPAWADGGAGGAGGVTKASRWTAGSEAPWLVPMAAWVASPGLGATAAAAVAVAVASSSRGFGHRR